MLADAYKDDGRHAEAGAYIERGLALARGYGLPHATMSLLTSSGWMTYHRAALGQADVEEATAAFRAALEQATRSAERRYAADAWSGLGQCGVRAGDGQMIDDAIAHLTAAEPLPPHLEARRTLLRAARAMRAGNYDDAAAMYVDAASFCRAHALWSREVDAVLGQGAAASRAGRTEDAERHWSRIDDLLARCPRVRHQIAEQVRRAMRTDSLLCPL